MVLRERRLCISTAEFQYRRNHLWRREQHAVAQSQWPSVCHPTQERALTSRIIRTLACLVLTMFVGVGAIAQEAFPSRPITLISGFAGGGVADATLRYLAESASKHLGQPVILKH